MICTFSLKISRNLFGEDWASLSGTSPPDYTGPYWKPYTQARGWFGERVADTSDSRRMWVCTELSLQVNNYLLPAESEQHKVSLFWSI